MTAHPATRTAAMAAGRRGTSCRRGRRGITVTAIARRAGVDRTFCYRHRDLLEQIHAVQTQPSDTHRAPTVSRASLHADLLAAQQRTIRLAARAHQLESRLSELLGEQTWRASGLGAPDDIDQLNHRIVTLEQQTIDLQLQLDERTQDLDATRAANRALMTQIKATRTS